MIPLSSRATGLSLILRSASLTWDGRRQKLVNSHFVATSCQMTKDSSLLKHWILLVSVATNTWEQMMWQGWLPYPSEAHPCHGTQNNRMLSCARAVRLQTDMLAPSGSHRAQWPGFTLARLPSLAPSCRMRNVWWRLKSPGYQKITSQRSGASPGLIQMNLKTWLWRSGSFLRAVGSNIPPIMVPWTSGEPCIPQGFHDALVYTNKSCSVLKK